MSPSPALRLRALADPMMAAVARTRPVYAQLFAQGDGSLEAFLRGFSAVEPPALQPRQDYIDIVSAAVGTAQGEAMAQRIRRRLERSPLVFTANHLCLECMPLTVQSMVLAALQEDPAGMLPVEASALIPADNASYPVGLMLARRKGGKPLRVPILSLSRREKRQITLLLPPYSAKDLARAEQEVRALHVGGDLAVHERDVLHHLVTDILGGPDLLSQGRFVDQACMATPRLWDAWFTPEARASLPPLAYLSCESIRGELLIRDLLCEGTPLNRVCFDSRLRREVVDRLDGVPCCWTSGGREGGSALLWKITPDRQTAPLHLEADALWTTDGERIPLEPETLVMGLRQGRLVPTSFLSLATGMVRGLVQIGGFNQADYLARMRQGLASALHASGYKAWADQLDLPLPPLLTAGLAAFASQSPEGPPVSAGGMEFMFHGGLRPVDLARARSLTLRDAMALELPGIARMVLGDEGWRELGMNDLSKWQGWITERLPILCS